MLGRAYTFVSSSLWVATLSAMVLGVLAGLFLQLPVSLLTLLARLPVDLIKALATPLLFVVVLESVGFSRWPEGALRWFFLVVGVNAAAAFAISLLVTLGSFALFGDYLRLSSLLPPVTSTEQTRDWTSLVETAIPKSLVEPFGANQVLAVVFLALLLGFALRAIGHGAAREEHAAAFERAERALALIRAILQRSLEWCVRLVPIAIFAALAKSVGQHGIEALARLFGFVALVMAGMGLQVFVVYQSWIRFGARIPLGLFWRVSREPATTAFAANSSLATLPVTLRACDELGVRREAARLSAGIGTNFNNDGILLYEIVAALCLVYSLEGGVTFARALALAGTGLLATMGVAGVPEAGLVALSLVVSVAGLPAEAVPLLLGVDWLLARLRSSVNVLADITVAASVDGLSRDNTPAKRRRVYKAASIVLLFFFVGCSQRAPLENRADALRPSSGPKQIVDVLDSVSFVAGLRAHAKRLRESSNRDPLVFGPRLVLRDDYASALEDLANAVVAASSTPEAPEEMGSPDRWDALVRERFEFFSVYGDEKGKGEALVTGYYEPEIQGARAKTEKYSQPLYERPTDLVEVAVSQFGPKAEGLSPMRGRIEKKDGKLVLLPYWTRQEIDGAKKAPLPGAKTLAYVDPIEAFWIQIQGSATVVLDDGSRLRVGYADQNGHPYQPIGKFLIGVLPKEKISIPVIEAHLRSMTPADRDRFLFQNPSFIFFTKREGSPRTSFSTDVFPGRTIAADARFFPKGALVYLDVAVPHFASGDALEPDASVPSPRFVFDSDTGGAIRGGGRVDLYLGTGKEVGRVAGVLKERARVWYLVPKVREAQRSEQSARGRRVNPVMRG